MLYAVENMFLTHNGFLAEKDVDNSKVLLPGIVEVVLIEYDSNLK